MSIKERDESLNTPVTQILRKEVRFREEVTAKKLNFIFNAKEVKQKCRRKRRSFLVYY